VLQLAVVEYCNYCCPVSRKYWPVWLP